MISACGVGVKNGSGFSARARFSPSRAASRVTSSSSDRHAGVGEVRGDLRAHGAGAKDSSRPDSKWHWVAVRGSGFRVRGSGSGFGVQVPGSGFRFRVRGSGSGFEVQVPGSRFRFRVRVQVPGSGFRFRVRGSGSGFEVRFRVRGSGSGFEVQVPGSGLRVRGSGSGFEVQVQVRGSGSRSGFRFQVPRSRFPAAIGDHTSAHPVLMAAGVTAAKSHEDIVAWQLAVALRDQVFAITAVADMQRHRSFCDQIRRSSSSTPANIAEGFRRYKPRDFARYLRIALGSLGETQNHLQHAKTQRYISGEEFSSLWTLSSRAIGACSRLRSYLATCPDRN